MKPVAALVECTYDLDGEFQFEGGATVWINAPEGQFIKGKKYLVSIKEQSNVTKRIDLGPHIGSDGMGLGSH